MQSFKKKNNERSLRYLKTDKQTDRRVDEQGRLLWTPTGKHGIQRSETFDERFLRKWPKPSILHPLNDDFPHIFHHIQMMNCIA